MALIRRFEPEQDRARSVGICLRRIQCGREGMIPLARATAARETRGKARYSIFLEAVATLEVWD